MERIMNIRGGAGMRKLRLVTVHVAGQPARHLTQNDGRFSLLAWLCEALQAVGWGGADVVLLPAGFLHDEVVLGPLGYEARKRALLSTPTGFAGSA